MADGNDLKKFMAVAASGEAPRADLVGALADSCPWFVLPAALRLQRAGLPADSDERRMLAARVALGMADRTAMMRLADAGVSKGSILRLRRRRLPPPTAPSIPSSTPTARSTPLRRRLSNG